MKLLLPLLLLTFACSYVPVKAPDVTPEFPSETVPTTNPKVVFTADSSLDYIHEVVRISNCVISNEDFLKEVEAFPKYDYTDKTSKQVADSLRNPKPVIVSTYRTKNPWSSVIATTYSSDPTTIYFNTRRNPREMPSMVNTSFHEMLHLQGWSHGDNYEYGKEKSVNHMVGTISEKYLKKCETGK